MALTPTTYNTGNALESNSAKDLDDNARVIDVIANDLSGENVIDRRGNERRTLKGLENEYLTAIQGIEGNPIGAWTAGVTTFNALNDYAIYNGVPYRARTTTTLPYVAQGADPTASPDNAFVQPYQQNDYGTIASGVEVKHRRGTSAEIAAYTLADGEVIKNDDDGSLHVGDGVTAGGVKSVNENTLKNLIGENTYLVFDTAASLQSGATVGSLVKIIDRGSAVFKVTDGGTPNSFDILDAGSGNTAVYQHIIGTRVYPEHFGAVGDGVVYETDVITAWGEYGNALTPKAAKGVYLIDDTIELKGDIVWDEGSKFSVDSTFQNLNVIEITTEKTTFEGIDFIATNDAGDHRYIYSTGVAGLKMKSLRGENLESIGVDSYPVFNFDGCPDIDIDGVTFVNCVARNLLGVWNSDYTVRNVKSYGSCGRIVDAVGDVDGSWDHIRAYNHTPDARLSANAVYTHTAGERVSITDVKITGEFRESDEQAVKLSRNSKCRIRGLHIDVTGPALLVQGSPSCEITDFFIKTTSVLTPVQFYPHPTTATNYSGVRLRRGKVFNLSNSAVGGGCINLKGSIGGYLNRSSDVVFEDVEAVSNSTGSAAITCNDDFILGLELINVNIASTYASLNTSASGAVQNTPRRLKIRGGSYKTLTANAIPIVTANETIAPPVGFDKSDVSVVGADFVHEGTGPMVQSRNSVGLLNVACVNNTYEGSSATPFDLAAENAPVDINNVKIIS